MPSYTKNALASGATITKAALDNMEQGIADAITAATTVTSATKTAAYTLAAADAGTVVEVNATAATNVTVPAGTFKAGDIVEVFQYGTGQVTLVAGSGLTLRTPASLQSRAQYSSIAVRFRTASEAVVGGDLA